MHVGARHDLPRQHFLRLLQEASAAVRTRLAAEHPEATGALETVLGEVVGGIRNEARKVSRDYAAARERVEACTGPAGSARRKCTASPASASSRRRRSRWRRCARSRTTWWSAPCSTRPTRWFSSSAKLAGFSSTTAKAILLLKAADRGLSAQALEQALSSYSRLQMQTARRVLDFYRVRIRGQAGPIAATG